MMRGHEKLIAMRRTGFVPDWVFIETDSDKTRAFHDWEAMDNTKAVIQLDASDKRLDMRCVTGLRCFIDGSDAKRVETANAACIAAGAARVIASVGKRLGSGEFTTFQTISTTDTDGVFTYDPREVVHG